MEDHTESAGATWAIRQCPFIIEYVPRVLDDIRLAVMDAFFSLPHGGAEIGGILLGSHSEGRLTIAGHEALDCEHAFGPGFALSARDKLRLAGMLAAERPVNLRPVGWYHSHTRSQIYLSEADLELHNDYFPESWQVALVMKPHTFQPAMAGFFFREPGGEIRASGSYLEFQVGQLAVRPLPAAAPPHEKYEPRAESQGAAQHAASSPPPKVIAVSAGVIETVSSVRGAAAGASQPDGITEAGPAPELAVPRFLDPLPRRSWRWLKIVGAATAVMAIGSAGIVTRQAWLPRLLAGFQRLHGGSGGAAAQTPPAALGLSVLDYGGQLHIRWDRNSAAVRNGSNALLEILDTGAAPQSVPLDEAHLQSGSFTYARQGERVDVALSIGQPKGARAREVAAFLGKAPENPEDAAALRRERDEAAERNVKLESDLKAAIDRNKKLERSLSDARALLRNQQRQRLENQIVK
jgi:proteasome lid subunit RPN8/RPN11